MRVSRFRFTEHLLLTVAITHLSVIAHRAAVLHVPGDSGTIQEAVNAAKDGDTIRIAPGLYEEQIIIQRKTLTLEGAPGATIRMVEGYGSILNFGTVAMVGIDRCTNVVLRGLTFDGDRLGEAYQTKLGFQGILYTGSSGLVEDCIVKGFRLRNVMSAFGFVGITAANSLVSTVVEVEIRHCRFEDNGMAINVRGRDDSTSRRLNFRVHDNVIAGVGPDTRGESVGIMVCIGATGEVFDNEISDHHYIGTSPSRSYGIVGVDWHFWVGFSQTGRTLLPVRYENNRLIANQVGIASAPSDGSVFLNNYIDGGGIPDSLGVQLTGNTNQVIGNAFTRLSHGVELVSNDPFFGTSLGLARNPTLRDNRFCEVTNAIVVQPKVTGVAESGTLLCPFTLPETEVYGAVLLRWPVYERDLTLESSETVEGPWTALDTFVHATGVSASATVQTSTKRAFFRLRRP